MTRTRRDEESGVLSAKETEALLSRLCVELGFCLPPEAIGRLVADPPADVIAFTDAVFVEEGLSPITADGDLHRQVRDRVHAAFRKHRGPETERDPWE